MTHVFVVDENTFKWHLEFMFAGTGANDKKVRFLEDCKTNSVHYAVERNLVGMIADVSKIRVGDKVVFYLQAKGNRQGMFFGVFKACSKAFFDEIDSENYIRHKLGKGLSFRILIEPDEVYANGITEHEYLDKLVNKEHPFQMCWSLIYRKLKGNRGCTMITDHEYEDLVSKLKIKNNNISLGNNGYTFDANKNKIEILSNNNTYEGRRNSLEIFSRLLVKANHDKAFETHLQAYLMQKFDIEPIRGLLLPNLSASTWIGNEVSCGVGMQRIDILIIQETATEVYFKICELKYGEPSIEILTMQLPWYIEWLIDYIVPNYISLNKKINILPSIIARETTNQEVLNFIAADSNKKKIPNICMKNTEYIGFDFDQSSIKFKKII